jgi:hypothetical protein
MIRTQTPSVESPEAAHNSRVPGGHPEGYLEAFANLYRNFALTLLAESEGDKVDACCLDFPSVVDGVEGMLFVEKVVASSQKNAAWVKWDA